MDASISSVMRKLSTQRSPQEWKAVVSLDPLGVQLHPIFFCHLCQLRACGKHLQSRGYFSSAEKSGTSSQGATGTKKSGWGGQARSVCTTIPKLGAWKAREIYLVVTPKTIVLFGPLCCSLMPQLLLCNLRFSIKMTATVSTEMLCSCKGGCLSNVSLVSKNSPGAKICSSRTDPWTGAALHRWGEAGRGVPLLFGSRHVPHTNNFISFCHSLSGRTGLLQVVSGPIFFKLCSPESTGFLMHVKGLSTWREVFVVTKNTFQYHCHCGFHTKAHNEITDNLSSYIHIRSCFSSHSLTP